MNLSLFTECCINKETLCQSVRLQDTPNCHGPTHSSLADSFPPLWNLSTAWSGPGNPSSLSHAKDPLIFLIFPFIAFVFSIPSLEIFLLPLPMVPFDFSGFCGFSGLYTHIWRFRVRNHSRERTHIICLSGSVLPCLIYFLDPYIYLQISWFCFSSQLSSILLCICTTFLSSIQHLRDI